MSVEFEATRTHLKAEHKSGRRTCAGCGVNKDWIFKRMCGMNRQYVDENGKNWNANLCRECANKKYGTAYQKSRRLRAKARAAMASEDKE